MRRGRGSRPHSASCGDVTAGGGGPQVPLTFSSVSSASSKAERPPSLSLYPNVEGMVRGGLGGARSAPGRDIWQVSELDQVGQTAALSPSRTVGVGVGGVAVPLSTLTRSHRGNELYHKPVC